MVPGVSLDSPLSVESASLPRRLQVEALPASPPPLPPPPNDYPAPIPLMDRGPVGGRLRLFLSQWRRITDNVFVLSVVAHGFIISPSPDFPGVLRLKTVTPGNLLAQAKIEEEIVSLLQKCAIVKVDDRPHFSLSPIFVIPKKSGGLCVILNLKRIDVFIPPQHFRMESLTAVLPQLHKDDWAVTLDLQDAYLHVPIHPSSRHLLCFAYKDQVYQYQVLPFGLKDSPWVFTRLVAVLIASLCQSGPPSLGYRRDGVPVVGSTSLRVPPVQSAPSSTSESSSGRSRPPSHSPSLASETLVSSPSVATGGLSEEPSASPGPSSAYLPLPSSSSGSSASFTLAAFRKRGQEAGLSERAADFAAQSLRPSTRCSYDARLAGFLKWCSQSACDPYTASLGSIADFLVSLFDKNSSVSTIRGYRSLIPPSSPGS